MLLPVFRINLLILEDDTFCGGTLEDIEAGPRHVSEMPTQKTDLDMYLGIHTRHGLLPPTSS